MATEFKDYRQTNEITLPVSGATVQVYDGLKTSDIQALQAQGDNMDVTEAVRRLIASWDFEQDGKPVEITAQNVGELHMKDFTAINESANLNDFLEESEKTSQTGS